MGKGGWSLQAGSESLMATRAKHFGRLVPAPDAIPSCVYFASYDISKVLLHICESKKLRGPQSEEHIPMMP